MQVTAEKVVSEATHPQDLEPMETADSTELKVHVCACVCVCVCKCAYVYTCMIVCTLPGISGGGHGLKCSCVIIITYHNVMYRIPLQRRRNVWNPHGHMWKLSLMKSRLLVAFLTVSVYGNQEFGVTETRFMNAVISYMLCFGFVCYHFLIKGFLWNSIITFNYVKQAAINHGNFIENSWVHGLFISWVIHGISWVFHN